MMKAPWFAMMTLAVFCMAGCASMQSTTRRDSDRISLSSVPVQVSDRAHGNRGLCGESRWQAPLKAVQRHTWLCIHLCLE